jgi:hypothetical protein
MAKMFTPPKAPAVVTTTAPVVTATPVTTAPAPATVTAPAPATPVVETKRVVADPVPATPDPAPVPAPVTTPKVVETTKTPTPATPVVKPETDPIVAAEQALAKRDRSISGTVLTSWRGVLQPTATGSAGPARKRLLGE